MSRSRVSSPTVAWLQSLSSTPRCQDPAELQSDSVWPGLVAAVESADPDLFVPVETVTFVQP